MNRYIKKEIDNRKKEYKNNPARIAEDFNIEEEAKNGYAGRQILELLQNAVDEMRDTDKRKVEIKLSERNKTLIISNTGRVFSVRGVESLMSSHLSPKHDDNNYIGNKGTGFRSILSWAKEVSIYSGNLSISFSKDYANKIEKELLEDKNIEDFFKRRPNFKRKIAVLRFPKIIQPIEVGEFDTVIKVSLKDSVIDDIKKQISNIDSELLLFLENLEELYIDDFKNTKIFKRKNKRVNKKEEIVEISISENNKEISKDSYIVKKYEGYIPECIKDNDVLTDNKLQQFFIKIACKTNCSVGDKTSKLYSYFKTDISFPLPIIVNASFDLTADRNYITDSKINKFILEKLVDHIFEIAEERTQNSVLTYDILNTFIPKGEFQSLEKFNFEDLYIKKLKAAKIYPTIDGKYKNIEDVVLYKTTLSTFLNPKKAENVLIFTEDSNIIDFIDKNGNNWVYEYESMINKLREDISSCDQKCECLFSIIKEYQSFDKRALRILDKRYENKDVFLQATRKLSLFPRWANIILLEDKYKDKLIELFSNEENREFNNRDLTSKLKIIKEYNFESIVTSLLKSSEYSIEKNKEFILWLYKNKTDANNSSIQNLDIKLLNKNENLCSAKELYLNEEIEKLCPADTTNRFIDINFYKDDKIKDFEDFKSFLVNVLGLQRDLKKDKEKTITNNNEIKSWFLSSKNLEFPIWNNYRGHDEYNSLIEFYEEASASIKVKEIDLLKEILKNNSTEKILDFILPRKDLYFSEEENYYCIEFTRIGCKRNPKYHRANLLNYNLFLIKTIKWIEIDGTKYAPEDLMLSKNYAYESKRITLKYLDLNKLKKRDWSLKELKSLFLKFGTNEDFSTVPIEKLYGILNDINEKKSVSVYEKKLLTRIYKELIDPENIFFKNNYYIPPHNFYEFNKFLKDGKVLCKNGELVAFEDVFYEGNPSNREDKNFIDIPYRRNSTHIKERLCVEVFKVNAKISDYDISPFNDELLSDFEDFKIYAYAYRMQKNKTEQELIIWKNLTITFCKNILINHEDGISSYLKDYDFVCEKNESFFKITNLEKTIELATAISDVVLLNLKITDDEFKDKCILLYKSSKKEREYLANKDGIDIEEARYRWGLQSTREENFNNACNKLKLNLSTDIFKIDELSKMENLRILRKELINVKKDINDFNQIYEYEKISLIDYYLRELEDLRESNKDCYANSLYLKYKDNKEDWDKYYEDFNDYKSYNYKTNVEDSVIFDPKVFFENKWEIISCTDANDRIKAWQINKNDFEEGKDNPDDLDEFYHNYSDEELYLEFETKKAEELWKIFIKERRNPPKKDTNVTNYNLEVSKKVEFYDLKNNPISLKKNNKLNDELSSQAAFEVKYKNQISERNKKELGKNSEEFAYNSAIDEYGVDNVKWESQYAKDKKINPDGRDGLGYDLWYKDNDKKIYVEVKSRNYQIHMTSNEYNFATEHKDCYEVWLVDLQKKKIGIIKDITNKDQYPLIPESYIIKINEESFEC